MCYSVSVSPYLVNFEAWILILQRGNLFVYPPKSSTILTLVFDSCHHTCVVRLEGNRVLTTFRDRL
jgi:hypothetical protein